MWCLIPSTSLPAQAEESWEICCSDIDLLAQSKSKHIPEKFCWQDSLTAAYLDSLSGTMSQHLESTTQQHEATSSGSEKGVRNSPYVAGSRSCAKTSALPAKAQVSQDRAAACGATWRASLAKYDPDASTWKTAQRSFLEDSESSLEIWPRWGSMRNGELYQRAMLAHPICENGSGFSHPTPTTRDWKGASNGQKEDFSRWTTYLHHAVSHDHYTTYPNPSSSEAVMGWPIGWTELGPLEMDKFQQWRQQHGGF